jgi:hypothetical protein
VWLIADVELVVEVLILHTGVEADVAKVYSSPYDPTGGHDTVSINNRKGIINKTSIAIMAKKMKKKKMTSLEPRQLLSCYCKKDRTRNTYVRVQGQLKVCSRLLDEPALLQFLYWSLLDVFNQPILHVIIVKLPLAVALLMFRLCIRTHRRRRSFAIQGLLGSRLDGLRGFWTLQVPRRSSRLDWNSIRSWRTANYGVCLLPKGCKEKLVIVSVLWSGIAHVRRSVLRQCWSNGAAYC